MNKLIFDVDPDGLLDRQNEIKYLYNVLKNTKGKFVDRRYMEKRKLTKNNSWKDSAVRFKFCKKQK